MNDKNNTAHKYFILTFGCQMNEHDSEVMAGFLEEMGYCPARTKEEADIILINTCCVRETAENKVYGLLGQLKKLKINKPALIIGIGGCMTQQRTVAEKIKSRFPYVDLIFGTHNLHQLKKLIKSVEENRKVILALHEHPGPAPASYPIKRASNIKAWVVITHGCNNFCTYCVVPYVRGRERSRRSQDLLAEIEKLAAKGYKEVTLLGQNVNAYGKDLPGEIDFAGLLANINKIGGIERIRFTTSHPKDFSLRLIRAISCCERVCEHIHLPVQSGSNKILQLMNRKYSREHYLLLIEKIRQSIPGVSITTDIMVGFPGETEEDFLQTMDLVKKIRFDSAFMFIYNTRPGTLAANMTNQVEEREKRNRIKILIEKQNSITKEINASEVGKIYSVLVDGISKTNPEFLSGRTRTNKLVFFPGRQNLLGNIIDLEIIEGRLTHLVGKRL